MRALKGVTQTTKTNSFWYYELTSNNYIKQRKKNTKSSLTTKRG